MPSHLIVRLPAHADGEADYVLIGETESSLRHLDASELPLIGEDTRIIAVVPSEEVVLRQVHVPVRGKARILQTVPFALEDNFAEDVAELHFAAGPQDPDGVVPVAAVSLEQMGDWQQMLVGLGLKAKVMYTDAALLHPPAHTAIALIENDRLLLASDGQPAVAMDVDSLPIAIAALSPGDPGDPADAERDEAPLEQAGEEVEGEPVGGPVDESSVSAPPATLTVYASAEDLQRHNGLLELVAQEVGRIDRRELQSGATALLAEQAAREEGAINLLQGAFAPPSQFDMLWRQWQAAAILAGLFLITLIGGKSAQLIQLTGEDQRLRSEIVRILQETCPQVRTVVDPQRQMQQCVGVGSDGAATAAEEELFLAMLGTLSGALRDTPNTRINEVRFARRKMDLKLMAPNVDAIDRIKQLVADRGGIDLTIEQVNPQPNEVEFRIELSKPAV